MREMGPTKGSVVHGGPPYDITIGALGVLLETEAVLVCRLVGHVS